MGKAPAVHRSNEEMAASCGMSKSHFRKVFRKEIGMAPNRYCERLRMDRACKALSQTEQCIHEIALALGFDDPLYFSQRFHAVIGVSPRVYRQSVTLGQTD